MSIGKTMMGRTSGHRAWWVMALSLFMGTAAHGQTQGEVPGQISERERLTKPVGSTEDLLDLSAKRVEEMKATLDGALAELEAANDVDDFERMTCINNALTAMKGLLKIADANLYNLKLSVAQRDPDTVEHESIKLRIAAGKFQELDLQVKSCGGPDLEGTIDGRPDIQRILDRALPEEDPVEALRNVEILLERPPSASVFF